MSIVRFTAYKQELFAPRADGGFREEAFDGAAGRLGEFTGPAQIAGGKPHNDYLEDALADAAKKLKPRSPVLVMVHGFQFDPRDDVTGAIERAENPHQRIYHFAAGRSGTPLDREKEHHTTGWPGRLGFAPDDGGEEGVAVAFGWYSNPGFFDSILGSSKDFHQLAYHFAGLTTWPFIAVLHALANAPRLAGREIDLFCHSLGSRVVVNALVELARTAPQFPRLGEVLARIGRVILLGGSERVPNGLMAAQLAASGAAGKVAFYNAVLRKDEVLDHLAEKTHVAEFPLNQVLGHNGLAPLKPGNWLDLQLDGLALQRWCERNGTPIDGGVEKSFASHWVYYTYPDNMALYRRILRDRADWSVAGLRAEAIPDSVELEEGGN